MSIENMTLVKASLGEEHTIKEVDTKGDQEMSDFLLSLGCYAGERITIISKLHKNFIVSVNGARYSLDEELANSILIQ